MREITSHKVNGLNEALKVVASDEPGPGGASHCYLVYVDESKFETPPGVTVHEVLQFQKGPIGEKGINGISNEALLAVVEDRLKAFQSGAYACDENHHALTAVTVAMMWLKHRTENRTARGVEGTMAK